MPCASRYARPSLGLMSPSHAASTGLLPPFAASATARAASAGAVTAAGEYMANSAATPGFASAAAGAFRKRCGGGAAVVAMVLALVPLGGGVSFEKTEVESGNPVY